MKTIDQSGSAILTVLIISSVVLGIGIGITTPMLAQRKAQQQISLTQAAQIMQSSILGTLSNNNAWLLTVARSVAGHENEQPDQCRSNAATDNNQGLRCLMNQGITCAAPAGGAPLTLYQADGKPLVTTDPTTGFDRMGMPCAPFGTESCPFRYVLSWQCANGPCTPTDQVTPEGFSNLPIVKITGTLYYQGASSNSFNPTAFNFTVNRGRDEHYISSTCAAMGGFYDQRTEHCTLLNQNVSCDPNSQYLAGIDDKGTPVCRDMVSYLASRCRNGSAVVGIDPGGQFICFKF